MKIILLQDVANQGKKGQVVDVSDGYALNFLIPKKMGALATSQVQAKIEKENKEALLKKQRQEKKLQELKKDLEKRTFTIYVKVGDKGQVFGGAHEKEIIEAMNKKMNLTLEKNQVELLTPVKQVGVHIVKIKLASQISAEVKVSVEVAP